jgi:2,3-bisphosphoglycerate-independent phosphoglycerate mutase
MSAFELTAALCPELEKGIVDFVCLNFANGDMVGHTGIMEAAIKR